MSSGLRAIKARRVITPLQDLRDGVVIVEGDKIAAVGLASSITVPESARVIDVGAKILAPGFFDLHHHGAMGAYAADGPDAVIKIAQYLVKTGTTGWLPTVNSLEGVKAVVEARRRGTGTADVVGVHMEGPFLAPKRVPGHVEQCHGRAIR